MPESRPARDPNTPLAQVGRGAGSEGDDARIALPLAQNWARGPGGEGNPNIPPAQVGRGAGSEGDDARIALPLAQNWERGSGGEGITSASFDAYLQEHKLVGSCCRSCGALHVPPRPICPACHGEEMAWRELSGRGRLVAFTAIHVAPTAMIEAGYGRQNPYCAGIVQLEEGPMISAQILGLDATRPEGIATGTPLRIAFVEHHLSAPSSSELGADGNDEKGSKRRVYLAFEPTTPPPSGERDAS